MDPLDLRIAPPRPPRAELGGIVFLARSVDKLRATLPGGDLGDYSIDGFTEMMFETLGIGVEAVRSVVANAADEADVAAYVAEHARAGGIEAWHTFILNREIFNGDRAAAIEEFPWLADHPEIRLSVDMLAEDDRRSFAG